MSGSTFTEGVGGRVENTPQCCTGSKKPSAFRVKGELKRRNKLISSARPFKILQNETKIIEIGQAVLKIFNFKDRDLDNFTRKNDRKTENVVFFRGFAQTEEQWIV